MQEESPPRYETLPVNSPDSGYEYIALTSHNQSFTVPVQVSIETEDTVSTGQVKMEPDHTEEHVSIDVVVNQSLCCIIVLCD